MQKSGQCRHHRHLNIKSAYDKLMQKEIMVTDDAMVVEQFMNIPVKLIKGTYENIKITTQEDWKIAEVLMEG